jgi:hypothetical protein
VIRDRIHISTGPNNHEHISFPKRCVGTNSEDNEQRPEYHSCLFIRPSLGTVASSSNFVYSTPSNLYGQKRKTRALIGADKAVVRTLRVILSDYKNKCVVVYSHIDSFLSGLLRFLAYNHLSPKLEVPLVTGTFIYC